MFYGTIDSINRFKNVKKIIEVFSYKILFIDYRFITCMLGSIINTYKLLFIF